MLNRQEIWREAFKKSSLPDTKAKTPPQKLKNVPTVVIKRHTSTDKTSTAHLSAATTPAPAEQPTFATTLSIKPKVASVQTVATTDSQKDATGEDEK